MANDGKGSSNLGFAITVLLGLTVFAVAFSPIIGARHFGRNRLICASNMKQLGLGFIEYSQDYDQQFPAGIGPRGKAGQPRSPGLGWASQLYPYVKSLEVFNCPDSHTQADPSKGDAISYAYSSNVAKSSEPGNDNQTISQPNRIVLLFEVSGANYPLYNWPTESQISHGPLSPVGDGTRTHLKDGNAPCQISLATGDIGGRPDQFAGTPRHDGGSYYLFVDGHVKWLQPGKVSSGSNAITPDDVQQPGVTGRAAGSNNPDYAATFSTK